MLAWLRDLTSRERRTMLACWGGWTLDGFDQQLYSYVVPTVIAVWGMSTGAAGTIGTVTVVTSSFGGWFAGALADRFGRVRVLQIARCEEANMYDAHRAALATADDSCTLVTDLISGRPARYIRNKLIDDLVGSGLKPLPVPAQLSLTFPLGAAGDRDWAVLLSGQSAALTKDTNAAELVQRLAEETARRLRVFA